MVFLFIVIAFIIGLVTSKVEIKILNLKYTKSDNSKGDNLEYLTKIKIYLFGIIPTITVKLNDKKIKAINRVNNNLLKNPLEAIKKLEIDVKAINLKANIGAKNVILTSTIIAFLSTLISILFSKIDVSPQLVKYKITPNYNVEEKLYKVNIFLSCAFELKMYHVVKVFLLQNS